jgi:PEP-CTERM motif
MTQNTGITLSTINGTLFDSPTVPNVTFMYTGPIVPGLAIISGFTILSTDSAINLAGDFTSQSTNNMGADAGTTEQLFGSVAIPAGPTVPEPSTWAMLLIGFAGLAFAFRQSQRKVSFA